MNKHYWENYYQNLKPTPFAKFCLKYIPKNKLLIYDLGCGNGRDSYYFSQNGYNVLGIDYAYQPIDSRNTSFVKIKFDKIMDFKSCGFDSVYSRFFLHSITTKEIIALIKWSNDLFMAEFRDKTDHPKLFKDHKRNLVDGEWVKQLLIKNGFKILYYRKSKGLAKYKTEDPTIVRIIAQKNVSI